MTNRFRAASATSIALVCGLSVAAAGCGKYSYSNLKSIKAFKDANQLYQQKDYKKAAERYEAVVANPAALEAEPRLASAYFFLGNSYDELYKPAKAGDAQNDAYIQKAIQNYEQAAQKDADPKMRKLALEYLAAAYGPEKLNDPAKAEPVYKQIIEMDPGEPANYAALAKLYEDAGRYDDAEAQLLKAQEVKPNDPAVYTNLANFYNKQGEFEKTIDALEKAANLNPNNPEGWHRVATFYWDKARKDYRLSTAQQKDYIMKGLAMEDKALGLNPEYMEAMTYKNILLRMQANTEKDPAKQKDLLNQADQLRNKVLDMQKRKQTGKG
jgi:tetratricopeptide (TPR) repeat protein